ncbi:HNH endonuclease signature motif containing protein [Microbacterium aureliae]
MTDPAPDEAAATAVTRLGEIVPEVVDIRRQIAALQAREASVLARASAVAAEWADAGATVSDADLAHRTVAAELGAALRVSDRTVQRQLHEAERLVGGFPKTMASLAAGGISMAHARIIVEAGERIVRDELRAEYEDTVLPYAEAESASRLRPVARRRAQWFLEETVRTRHRVAARSRNVIVFDLDDAMSEVRAVVPSVLAHGIHDRLTTMARDVVDAQAQAIRDAKVAAAAAESDARRAVGDTLAFDADEIQRLTDAAKQARAVVDDLVAARRSMNAVRADLLADLLLAGDPLAHVGTRETGLAAIHATVQVTVPVLSLIDSPLDDPFDATSLAGYGPIDPDSAKELAAGAPGWERILTHPVSGSVLAVDRYQPSEKMRRHLRIRDQHCRFPGCRNPAARSDLDHTVDHAKGGATAHTNLAHLCRRHHTLKHHTPWTVVQQRGGVLEWTSPTGRVYPDHPVSGVQFATDAEFDPAPF